MNITGIIAEYNPFHNGHLYQIGQARKDGADYVIIIMSGDFLQRGTPAVINKWERARMALLSGADLVIELPAVLSTASAQYFARGGVSVLDKLKCVDTITFGCETADAALLDSITSFLQNEPSDYQARLQFLLKKGNSFPKARKSALSSYLGKEAAAFISSPNNILALEYCLALKERNSPIRISPMKREGSGYHDSELSQECFSSASAIREALFAFDPSAPASSEKSDADLSDLSHHVPEAVFSILNENRTTFINQNDFSLLLKYKLLMEKDNGFTRYADVSYDLSDKIVKNSRYYESFTQFCELLKSKELTYSRINRALTHILLNITQDMYETAKANDYASYARVLGFRKDAATLLSAIGSNTSIPLVTKLADAKKTVSPSAYETLAHTIFCSDMYEIIVAQKTNSISKNEFTRQLVIV